MALLKDWRPGPTRGLTWLTLLLSAYLLLHPAPIDAQQSRAPAKTSGVKRVKPPLDNREAYRNKALLIPVHHFDGGALMGLEPLPYTLRDVVRLYYLLQRRKDSPHGGRFSEVYVLATRKELRQLRDEEERVAATDPRPDRREDARWMIDAIDALLEDPIALSMIDADRECDWGHAEAQSGSAPENREICSLTKDDIDEAIDAFAGSLGEADDAFLYISDHGFRVRGFNSLVLGIGDLAFAASDTWIDQAAPVGSQVGQEVSMASILEKLEGSLSRNIFIMHASCFKPIGVEKAAGLHKVRYDGEDRRVTIVGAATDVAIESPDIRGDVFTYYFGLAMSGDLERLQRFVTNLEVDTDGDHAISVQEAYDVARRLTWARQHQLPYIANAGTAPGPFILFGTPKPEDRMAVFVPPDDIPAPVGTTKGLPAPKRPRDAPATPAVPTRQLRATVDDKPAPLPVRLDAGTHVFDLIADNGEVLDSVRYSVRPGDHVRWEQLFLPRAQLEVGVRYGAWLEPRALLQAGSDGEGGSRSPLLWSAPLLRVRLSRPIVSRPDERWSLDGSLRLQVGSSQPEIDGNLLTTNYLVAPGLGVRYRRRLQDRAHTELLAGGHGDLYVLSEYRFRNALAVAGWGPELGARWKLGDNGRLALSLDLGLLYADLDCNPEIQDWGQTNLTPDVKALIEALPDRCGQTIGADGTAVYEPDPTLVVLASIGLGWEWKF